MRMIAGHLLQLRMVRAVGYLRELQVFLTVFDGPTWGMRAEMHLLAACVALHLSLRDLPRGDVESEKDGGVVEAFWSYWDRAHPTWGTADGESFQRKGELAEEDGGGRDLIARDVGLPMAHLLTAEWYLRSCSVSSSDSSSPNMLLLNLFKAIAVGKAMTGKVELELLGEPLSSSNTLTNGLKRPPMRSTNDLREETEAIKPKRPRLEERGDSKIDEGSFHSCGYALREVALSQQRRCATAFARIMHSLTHLYQTTHQEETINRDLDLTPHSILSSPNEHKKGDSSFSSWSSLHRTLLLFLKGFLALTEDCDKDAAVRAFRLAVSSSWRLLSPFHPCVIDSLVQLTTQITGKQIVGENKGDLVCTERALNLQNDSEEEEVRLLCSFLSSFLNSVGKEDKKESGEAEGEREANDSLVGIVLRAAACVSCSALFRLLEAFEGESQSSGEVTSNLSQSKLNYPQPISQTPSLESIRAWWGMQVRQLCMNKIPGNGYAPQLPTGAAQRRDLIAALEFLPNIAAYSRLR
ncbi:unnamed protein product [Phytomonas sp. Hart1]|nr:unnamed protein product [Phytomonas sp. Hart1]|eukprot:CCW71880.1 unnamed protein product [Phytomonas sp. isolate Hart1]